MRDGDEGLTSQDHENRLWGPSDVLLIVIALFVLTAAISLACPGFPR
jgi:hypothetical protein